MESVSWRQWEFVTDRMMRGLGERLRDLGADVVIFSPYDRSDCLQCAVNDTSRILLTCSDRLRSEYCEHISSERCIVLPSVKVDQQIRVLAEKLCLKRNISRCVSAHTSSVAYATGGEKQSGSQGKSNKKCVKKDIKFVCDRGTGGVFEALLREKVDVVYFGASVTPEQCLSVARKEGRHILTMQTTRYEFYSSQFPHVLRVFSHKPLSERIKDILAYAEFCRTSADNNVLAGSDCVNGTKLDEHPTSNDLTGADCETFDCAREIESNGVSIPGLSSVVSPEIFSTKFLIDLSVLSLRKVLEGNFDVVTSGRDMSHEACLKLATEQNRHVVTGNKKLFASLSTRCPVTFVCSDVPPDEQLAILFSSVSEQTLLNVGMDPGTATECSSRKKSFKALVNFSQLNLVIDDALTELGRRLQHKGYSVIFLSDGFEKATVKSVVDDGVFVVLTRSENFKTAVCQVLAANRCWLLVSDTVDHQIQEVDSFYDNVKKSVKNCEHGSSDHIPSQHTCMSLSSHGVDATNGENSFTLLQDNTAPKFNAVSKFVRHVVQAALCEIVWLYYLYERMGQACLLVTGSVFLFQFYKSAIPLENCCCVHSSIVPEKRLEALTAFIHRRRDQIEQNVGCSEMFNQVNVGFVADKSACELGLIMCEMWFDVVLCRKSKEHCLQMAINRDRYIVTECKDAYDFYFSRHSRVCLIPPNDPSERKIQSIFKYATDVNFICDTSSSPLGKALMDLGFDVVLHEGSYLDCLNLAILKLSHIITTSQEAYNFYKMTYPLVFRVVLNQCVAAQVEDVFNYRYNWLARHFSVARVNPSIIGHLSPSHIKAVNDLTGDSDVVICTESNSPQVPVKPSTHEQDGATNDCQTEVDTPDVSPDLNTNSDSGNTKTSLKEPVEGNVVVKDDTKMEARHSSSTTVPDEHCFTECLVNERGDSRDDHTDKKIRLDSLQFEAAEEYMRDITRADHVAKANESLAVRTGDKHTSMTTLDQEILPKDIGMGLLSGNDAYILSCFNVKPGLLIQFLSKLDEAQFRPRETLRDYLCFDAGMEVPSSHELLRVAQRLCRTLHLDVDVHLPNTRTRYAGREMIQYFLYYENNLFIMSDLIQALIDMLAKYRCLYDYVDSVCCLYLTATNQLEIRECLGKLSNTLASDNCIEKVRKSYINLDDAHADSVGKHIRPYVQTYEIQFVDGATEYANLIDHIKTSASKGVFGLAVIFNPSSNPFSHPHGNRPSIMAVSISRVERVFIVDLLKLYQQRALLVAVFEALLSEGSVIVGYDIIDGLAKLRATVEELAGVMFTDYVVDLKTQFTLVDHALLGYCHTNVGLKTLVQRYLGRYLDERERCSYWNRRPLRHAQINYAASAASCLLPLRDKYASLIY